MKKTFLWCLALTSLVATTSCSQDEIVDEPTPQSHAIGFDSFINKGTRAEINNTNFNAFQVWALEKTADNNTDFILSNVKIRKDGSNWIYDITSDQAYWRAGSCYTFLGVGPSENVSLIGAGRVITVNADKADPNIATIIFKNENGEVDLIAALNQTFQNTAWTAGSNATAQMNFCHLLTKIHFAFKNEMEDGSLLSISDVTITNSPLQGNAVLEYDPTKSTTSAIWTSLTAEPLSDTYASLLFGAAVNPLKGENLNDVFENTTNYYIKNGKTAQTREKLMIPVNTTILEVKFTINHKKGDLITKYTKTVNVTTPEGGWLSGNCYQLVATINSKNISDSEWMPITFSANVIDWIENENQTQELPEPEETTTD